MLVPSHTCQLHHLYDSAYPCDPQFQTGKAGRVNSWQPLTRSTWDIKTIILVKHLLVCSGCSVQSGSSCQSLLLGWGYGLLAEYWPSMWEPRAPSPVPKPKHKSKTQWCHCCWWARASLWFRQLPEHCFTAKIPEVFWGRWIHGVGPGLGAGFKIKLPFPLKEELWKQIWSWPVSSSHNGLQLRSPGSPSNSEPLAGPLPWDP